MKAVVVGAGGTTRDLLRGLGEIWDVTVIDNDPERLAKASQIRPMERVLGDGSSRVVLAKAGYEKADALVAASSDDDVNLEACRLALEAGLFRVVAVAADPERLPDYRELDVVAISPDRMTARRIEINLEPRRVSSAPFAAGMAEAIEFRVSEDSAVRGRRLRDLHSESWLIAAVLRDGSLIIPHGETTLQAGDLVTVVGAAADYPTIIRTFTAGEATFPTDFGKQIAVALADIADLSGPVAEAIYLTRNSAAEALLVLHAEPGPEDEEEPQGKLSQMLSRLADMAEGIDLRLREVSGPPQRTMLDLPLTDGVGMVVVRRPTGGVFAGRTRTVRLLQRLKGLGIPALVSAGAQSYRRVVVPAEDSPAGRAAARAAVDLAAYGESTLVGVAVVPPAFIVGSDVRREALGAVALLREQAAVQGVTVKRRIRQGNPVRGIESTIREGDLLVLGLPKTTPTLLTPGAVGHLARRVDTSIVLVPAEA